MIYDPLDDYWFPIRAITHVHNGVELWPSVIFETKNKAQTALDISPLKNRAEVIECTITYALPKTSKKKTK